jgi:hypothetical protein
MGIVLVGTKNTDNHLNEDYGKGQYENVTEYRAIEKLNLDSLRAVDGVQVENKPQLKGDVMDGLIVAMDMLQRHCGTKKYKKRIFVITDGEKQAKYDAKEKSSVIQNMNETDTRLNVITLDFCNELAEDDEEEEEETAGKGGVKRVEGETQAQHHNKEFLVELTSRVKGAIFPASVAIEIYQ